MWNQILKQSRSIHKFQNVPVLVLGNKHSGKRTFIDSLFQISKTVLPRRTTLQAGRLRDKTLSSVIDYAYLNAINLNDPDNKTQSRLQFYIVDDQQNKQIVEVLVNNPQLIQKLVIVIMLDYSAPWTFEIELDRWVTFAKHLLSRTGFSITKLDQMKNSVQHTYSTYKQPTFDQDGKLKKIFIKTEQSIQQSIPIPDKILDNNIRFPLVISVNKSDLQSTVLRDKQKISFVEYHLRKFCLSYGGTLIYTSTKNHINLDVFYEYILHRAYNFPLRFQAYTLNQESIFIPLGADNFQLLNDSIKVNIQSFSQMISAPQFKKTIKQQVVVQDDNDFFKKYLNMAPISKINSQISSSKILQQRLPSVLPSGGTSSMNTSTTAPQTTDQVKNFYQKLLQAGRSTLNSDTIKRQTALDSLAKHTSKLGQGSSNMTKKLLEISSRREAQKKQQKNNTNSKTNTSKD